MNLRPLSILLIAASFLLAGCLPESKNPLSTPATSRIDSRLASLYVEGKDDSDADTTYWHFHYHGAPPGTDKKPRMTTTLEVLGVAHQAESGLNTARYRALATRLGGRDYLSFIEVAADGGERKDQNYSFARYEVTWLGDLRIYFIDTEAVVNAVKTGKLHGKVKSGAWKGVLLTDSTERLAAFVTASDPAQLFSKKPIVFRRVAR